MPDESVIMGRVRIQETLVLSLRRTPTNPLDALPLARAGTHFQTRTSVFQSGMESGAEWGVKKSISDVVNDDNEGEMERKESHPRISCTCSLWSGALARGGGDIIAVSMKQELLWETLRG